MRILHVADTAAAEATAAPCVTLALARSVQSLGHYAEIVDLSAPRRPPRGSGQGVPLSGLSGRGGAAAAAFEGFLDERAGFDVAHLALPGAPEGAARSLALRRTPYVVTVNEAISLTSADAELLDRAAAITAVSAYVARALTAQRPGLAVRVVPNGLDLLSYARSKPGERRVVTFGYLGPVTEAAGAGLLAAAFGRAALGGAGRLVLAGVCPDRAYAEALAAGGAGQIVCDGPVAVADLPHRLQGFDVLCAPSLEAVAFPWDLYAGFAAGLPALASDAAGLGEVLAAHACGLVLPAGEAGAWASAMARVAGEPELLATWAALTPVPARIEEQAFVYLELYRAVVASAGGESGRVVAHKASSALRR